MLNSKKNDIYSQFNHNYYSMLRRNNSLKEAEDYRKRFVQAPEDTRTKDVMDSLVQKTINQIVMTSDKPQTPQDSWLVDVDIIKQQLIDAKVKWAHFLKDPEKIIAKAKQHNLIS